MRVVIAEDQVLLREGLARLFTDGGHEVISTLGDGETVVDVVDAERPDLVLIDIRMPPTYTDEGARAARDIKDRHPGVGVLVLSQHIETTHAVDLVGRPGFGYLLKDRVLEVEEFLDTAVRVAAGGSALDPTVVGTLVAPAAGSPLARLSDRERRVLELMAEGLTNTAIAHRLASVSVRSRRTFAMSCSSWTSRRATRGTAVYLPSSPICGTCTDGPEPRWLKRATSARRWVGASW